MAIVAFRQFRRQRQTQHLRTPSQASSPRSVTLPQLPSSSTCTFGNYIWYTAFPLKGLVLVQGTRTPQVKRYARHTQTVAVEPRKALCIWRVNLRGPLNRNVLPRFHGCPQPYRGHSRKARRAIVRDPGGTSPYSYSAQRYSYSYSMIAPAMERMLSPCRSTTSEYAYRDSEYDCDPGAGP